MSTYINIHKKFHYYFLFHFIFIILQKKPFIFLSKEQINNYTFVQVPITKQKN
jgi:hypothetical protein